MKLAAREVRVLQSLHHPAVVRLLEAFRSKSGRVYMVRGASRDGWGRYGRHRPRVGRGTCVHGGQKHRMSCSPRCAGALALGCRPVR